MGDAFATGPGGGIAAPNIGDPTLDILQGGGSSIVWSFNGDTGTWHLFETPGPVGPGGAIANLFNGCDYAFAGNGSRTFFSTGRLCSRPEQLPDAPAPVGPGGAIATPRGLVGQATDLIFGLRGGNTSDFWAYKLSELSKGATKPMPGGVLQGIFEQVVRADRLLGSVAVEDAIDAGVSGKKIVEAQAELAEGDAEAAKGGFEQAIERYRQAWQRVVSGN